uniref:Methionyl-tRNA formyltransferase, mitochondrial n=1 Tax=Paulinella chromatophora TaxID=39717 RepID=B1X5N3_PAUCH|nr:methionyl-tRNA formyltransferase [Paulinella chromatophora]ACB43252.1 methionyl-tRNA formyltransferase [Paulinella chromatophora]
MKIVFWGTPNYAVASLEALVKAGHDLVAVVTQPDRRRARGKLLLSSPVKVRALELGLTVYTPKQISSDIDIQTRLASLEADIYIVVAFGQILPFEILVQPRLGCWNGHGSLLPRWRGAGPIQWSVTEGDSQTGVCIIAMGLDLDTGPVLIEQSIDIGFNENAENLGQRLSQLTGELLVEAMPLIATVGQGSESERFKQLAMRTQVEKDITYAHMLTKQDFIIMWNRSALAIHRQVMGFYPEAFSYWRGKRLKVLSTEPLDPSLSCQLTKEAIQIIHQWRLRMNPDQRVIPGEILATYEGVGMVVSTGDHPILIRKAQLEDKHFVEGQALIQQMGIRIRSVNIFKNSNIP